MEDASANVGAAPRHGTSVTFGMKDPAIVQLLAKREARYPKNVTPYGTSEEEESGTGFRVEGIAAMFSAILLPDSPKGYLDVQIESYPPGAYLYQDEVTMDQFLGMIEEYRSEATAWRPEKWKQK